MKLAFSIVEIRNYKVLRDTAIPSKFPFLSKMSDRLLFALFLPIHLVWRYHKDGEDQFFYLFQYAPVFLWLVDILFLRRQQSQWQVYNIQIEGVLPPSIRILVPVI